MLLEGLLSFSLWGYIGITLLLTHITIACVTIFLHRHQSHHSLTLHPVISHFFRFWLWLTTGIKTREWVAIHRKHHAKCEKPDDPHSPQTKGIKEVLFNGIGLYRAEARNQDTLDKYGQGVPNDWLERNLYNRFPYTGISLMLLLDVLFFGVIGIAIFAVQMIWIPWWAAGVINGIGHYWGYRNFETNDASRNIFPWGILIGGEELHNNHHAHAASARLKTKWWEIDIGWVYIRLLETFGFAKVKRTAPIASIELNKQSIDMETVRAVVRNRFHILKLYGSNVIHPVLLQESRYAALKTGHGANGAGKKLFRGVRKLMTREGIELSAQAQKILNLALQNNRSLTTVYEFKQKLKALWASTTIDRASRVQRLQDWCADAEQTGIRALQEFSKTLRGYTLNIQ